MFETSGTLAHTNGKAAKTCKSDSKLSIQFSGNHNFTNVTWISTCTKENDRCYKNVSVHNK